MSLTTPSLPAELPAYAFVPLLSPVYTAAPPRGDGRPTSPSTLGSSFGLIGQLVSGTTGTEQSKAAVVRSVDASGSQVWIASSDGRIRSYEANDTPSAAAEGDTDKIEALELLEDRVVNTAKRSIDRIYVAQALNTAIILSEGQLTYHSLPSLAPLPNSAFPTVKGVTAFAVDEDSERPQDSLRICLIKRRSLHVLHVRKDGVTSLKDLPLHSGATVAALRRNHVCMADAETYSIVDLIGATAIPLMPIVQNTDENESDPVDPDQSRSMVNPRHRPAVACVGTNEFLFASHTGETTLGVFVNESGDPCRGTLEWASNVRSLTINGPHTIALLHNDSIEIHSLQTQEIVQVIMLASINLPVSMQPRSLAKTSGGLEVGAASYGGKIGQVEVSLLRDALSSSLQQDARARPSRSISNASSLTLDQPRKKTDAHVLLVCRNGLHALAPSTIIAQAEAFFDKDRIDEAIKVAEQVNDCGEAEPAEMAYIYMKAAYMTLRLTFFQTAFEYFYKARADPRLVIRAFPELDSGGLMTSSDTVTIPRGARTYVNEAKTIDDFILDNLRHNYSPHIKPDIESATSTVELKDMLKSTARNCLQAYLAKWRKLRREEGVAVSNDPEQSHKVDMVVDTVLAKLLAERGATIDLLHLLEGPNDAVLDDIEPVLLRAGMYHTLASTRSKRGDTARALDIWIRILDGEYTDSLFSGGPEDIYQHLLSCDDADALQKYGLWLIQKHRDLGLKLFTTSKKAGMIDTRTLFGKIRDIDADTADAFLESVVLQKRSNDSSLLTDLIKRYLDRLQELLQDSPARERVKALEREYAELVDSTSSPPSFLRFLVDRLDADDHERLVDRVRLKAALFLASTNAYDLDGAKTKLEQLEQQGIRGLTIERAIVYGKMQLDRQALSLLLITLNDMRSVEAYIHQAGNPLVPADISAAASKLALTIPRAKKTTKQERLARRKELARMVADLALGRIESESEQGARKAAHVINAYSIHLEALQVLRTVPDEWPIQRLQGFFTRSLQRSTLSQHEAALLKALAASQNLDLSDRLYEKQRAMGRRIESAPAGDSGGARRPVGAARRKSSAVKIETPLAFKQEEDDVVELKPS